MKVKRFLALVLVVVFAAALFAGCDVITKNEQRDFNQTLATVSYKGLTDTVTKGEFNDSFNSLAYYYVNYYGYTVEETAEAIVDSLAQRKLLILAIRYELSNGDNGKAVADLLTAVEKNEAVKSANESVKSWYDSIYEELYEELTADDETDDETEDDATEDEADDETVEPRPVRPDMAEAETDYDGALADEDIETPFFDKPYADFYEDDYTEEQKLLVEKALSQLKKELADNYIDYNYYLDSAYEAQLLTKYQRLLTKDYLLTNEDYIESVANQREEYISLNKELFANNVETNYSAALSTLSSLVYHPESEQGYGYVYNILLQFSDEQKAALTAFKASHTDKEVIKNYRAALANEITVMKSNLNYDPDCTDCEECTDGDNVYCTEADCTCRPYEVDENGAIKKYSATDVVAEFEAAMTAADTGSLSKYELFKARREIATQYIYMVGDDPGMYDTEKNNAVSADGKGYLLTPDGDMIASGTTSKRENLAEGFPELGLELIAKGLGSYDWCVTDFGIHIMYVSYLPYSGTYVDKTGAEKTIPTTGDEAFCLPLDYVVYYGREGDVNDPDKTLQEAIFDAMKTSFTTKTYQNKSQEIINANKDCIVRNDKLWKKLLKEYTEQLGA